MYEDILQRMKQSVRQHRIRITFHARLAMVDDNMGEHDIEHAILTGRIVARQHDKATAEYKYRVAGTTYGGRPMEVVAKLEPINWTVIITAYLL
jgi:hypothetical protein